VVITRSAVAAAFFARYSGTTLRTYRYKLGAFSRWLGVPVPQLPLAVLHAGATQVYLDVERYRAHLRDDRHASPATINGALAAIRTLVRFLRRAQFCSWTLDVTSERQVSYRDTRGPGLAAVRTILQAAARQPNEAKAARDVAIIRLLVDCALRRSEVIGLDLEHVELDQRGLPAGILIRGKGKAERERLSLPLKMGVALGAWLRLRARAEGPLFTALDRGAGCMGRRGRLRQPLERLTGESVAKMLRELARRSDLRGAVRPHGLRHTAITTVLDQGVGIREAQRFSRHADPRTLVRYDDNRQDIAGAVARSLSELI
jgi:integrase/recombinase XerC